MEPGSSSMVYFEDLFPSMVSRLGAEGFMEELRKGFELLKDEDKDLITFESLKRNSFSLLGLDFNCNKSDGNKGVFGYDDEDEIIREMMREGDFDGDGCLDLMEFCVLMFRLSPSLMDASRHCFHHSFF